MRDLQSDEMSPKEALERIYQLKKLAQSAINQVKVLHKPASSLREIANEYYQAEPLQPLLLDRALES